MTELKAFKRRCKISDQIFNATGIEETEYDNNLQNFKFKLLNYRSPFAPATAVVCIITTHKTDKKRWFLFQSQRS